MRKSGFELRFAAVVIALALAPAAAMAYIDPGNGAYMVQFLFAMLGAGLFFLRHPVRSLKSLWHWAFSREPERRSGADHSADGPARGTDAPAQEYE